MIEFLMVHRMLYCIAIAASSFNYDICISYFVDDEFMKKKSNKRQGIPSSVDFKIT